MEEKADCSLRGKRGWPAEKKGNCPHILGLFVPIIAGRKTPLEREKFMGKPRKGRTPNALARGKATESTRTTACSTPLGKKERFLGDAGGRESADSPRKGGGGKKHFWIVGRSLDSIGM